MRYQRFVILLALVGALGTACGGDGGGGGTAGDGGGGDGGGGGTATDTVTIFDNGYEPVDPLVTSGDTLTLVNDGEAAHTFTLEDGSIDEQVEPGGEGSVAVSLDPGTYPFDCTFHPEMSGTLTVE